ncbi:hypothetical protein [Virgibacillus siamensis]|uniref:hypothetical protein n=1 Tax=Virgibacillus siamensis TaxID=480071 RepID=UPI0009869E0A|nr:hypothetical protein [Virgibacillus siamensis]
MEAIMSIFIYAVGLFILYLVITAAVRHGIDNSAAGKALLEHYRRTSKADNLYRGDDLDNY